ncbi:MAG: outer membrane lipoprotein carrier protein LolA [Oscillospiraceae bacterium]|nr:outer membrane lipoprotein carrier protein LolA [Oscillospiraceae bacterium]
MRTKFLAFLLSLVAVSGAVVFAESEAVSSERIAENFKSRESVSGEFSQTKKLLDLDVSLESSGQFVFSAKKGLLWQTQKPVKSTVVVNTEKLLFFDKDDALSQTIEIGGSEATTEIFQVVRAVMLGEFSKLKKMFCESATMDGEKWVLELVPRDTTKEFPFEKIALCGDAGVLEKINFLSSKDNEETEILFTGVKADDAGAESAFEQFLK